MDTWKGFLAGFVGTVVLSALMVAKAKLGLMPGFNVIAMMAAMTGAGVIGGWLAHFLIGTVAWGGLFALWNDSIPGTGEWMKGAVFATGAWLLMMIFFLPIAGAGFFGMKLGLMVAVAALVLHWIFGIVMGLVYGWTHHAEHGQLQHGH